MLLSLAACKPFVSAGVDTAPRVTGAMAAMATEPRSASVGLGGGDLDFTIGLGLHVHELARDQAFAGSSSLDFQWSVLRWRGASAYMHAGPEIMGVADQATMMMAAGYGVRYGLGVAFAVSIFTVFADWHREVVNFEGGPAPGSNMVEGTMLGIALRR
ncbi:MAG: hypothetical protein NT062_00615 [Proteobacteria bacterium]|nr:hypothetical protein [Pseudomonadota bacterium]